jgi:ElaB/YqjD/DUF883 family membrane-anchored ribosome-binding protein
LNSRAISKPGPVRASAPNERITKHRRSRYSRAQTADIGEIEQRLWTLERYLERLGGRTSAGAVQAADRVGEGIASALTSIAQRLRGGANSVSDEALKLGNEAAKLGNDAVRRLSRQVEARPLALLAVAVGVGVLVGLASRRR